MNKNIRYSIQLDNLNKHELSMSIQKSVITMNEKHGYVGNVDIKITENEVSLWLANDHFLMPAEFWDYVAELSCDVQSKVTGNGYYYEKWKLEAGYFVLVYPAGNADKTSELLCFIQNKIQLEYEKYGQKSTAKVKQSKGEIQIWFDSESPYMDKAFWELLNNIIDSITEKLNENGFVLKRTEGLFDYIILHFQKTAD